MTKIIRGLLVTEKNGETTEFQNPLIALMVRRPVTTACVAFFLGLIAGAIRL